MLVCAMTELKTFQKFYAAYVTASVGVTNPRIVKAFASVPREDFLGPGPWEVNVDEGYILTPSADPALIYQDIVVALAPDRRINNGEPSLHARMLDAQEQIEKALVAFERNGFLLLVNDRQIESLDEQIEVTPATTVTFLKLVMLVGG